MLQTTLVIITFIIAAGYVLNKFVVAPILEKKKVVSKSIDGANTKCGSSNCGCN